MASRTRLSGRCLRSGVVQGVNPGGWKVEIRSCFRYNERDRILRPTIPLVRQALIVIAFLAFSANGFAQTTPAARELLDAMIVALVGGEKFLDAKEIQTSGRLFMFNRGEISAIRYL